MRSDQCSVVNYFATVHCPLFTDNSSIYFLQITLLTRHHLRSLGRVRCPRVLSALRTFPDPELVRIAASHSASMTLGRVQAGEGEAHAAVEVELLLYDLERFAAFLTLDGGL